MESICPPIERKQDLIFSCVRADLRSDSVHVTAASGRLRFSLKTAQYRMHVSSITKRFIDLNISLYSSGTKVTYIYFLLDKINFLLIFSVRDKFLF